MILRDAFIKDLNTIIEIADELFELERTNYDDNMIKNWAKTKKAKEYFIKSIKSKNVLVAETIEGGNRLYINRNC